MLFLDGAMLNGDCSIIVLQCFGKLTKVKSRFLDIFSGFSSFLRYHGPWYVNMAIIQCHSIFHCNAILLFSYECCMCKREYGTCVLLHTDFIFFHFNMNLNRILSQKSQKERMCILYESRDVVCCLSSNLPAHS